MYPTVVHIIITSWNKGRQDWYYRSNSNIQQCDQQVGRLHILTPMESMSIALNWWIRLLISTIPSQHIHEMYVIEDIWYLLFHKDCGDLGKYCIDCLAVLWSAGICLDRHCKGGYWHWRYGWPSLLVEGNPQCVGMDARMLIPWALSVVVTRLQHGSKNNRIGDPSLPVPRYWITRYNLHVGRCWEIFRSDI